MIHRCIDPVALALTAPGAPFETVRGTNGEVFRNIPHNLSDLYRAAQRHGARRMLQTEQVAYSYDDVFAFAARVARALTDEFGVKRGDYVAMAMLSGVEWMACFIAVHAVGATAAMVNTRCAPDEMIHAIGQVGARLVIADGLRAAALQTEQASQGWRMIVSGAPDRVRGEKDRDLAAILAQASEISFDPVDRASDNAAIVLFTSGTTGRPKAVRLDDAAMTHAVGVAGLAGAIQDQRYQMEFGRKIPPGRGSAESATIIAGPVFHFSGIMPFLRGAFFGAPLFVFTKWNAEVALELMEREPLARLGFVPTMLSDMLASPRVGPDNLGTLMVLANGAAALDLKLVERVRQVVPTVMVSNTYGQTESAAWVSTICGRDYIEHPESAGYVLPTVEVRIRRDDGADAAIGEHGEICMRGTGMMRGYIGDATATTKTIVDGWLRTGDNGWMDSEGRLYLADRRKNMIISGGENVYCAEVERVLGSHPLVAEVIAYGRPDERLGERIAATVVPRGGAPIDTEELRGYARAKLAGYKVPRDITVRPTPLPRTPTMKIDRGTFLREMREQA
ncbi:class I adenylate-forming enzyme family protein [uncultured Sphingomonas sp.]|uniref:class I adenylate-forming enzyme family protein n=1 Tax=uncultured Sphingomonas sp. TaxID=158754 RepID=UPI002637662B|nr:AMP-binding protein [uncultured Sphingomonas sp.]